MFKVMIVDDEPPFIRSISRQLTAFNSNFQVIDCAYNGKEALEKLAIQDIDVLITDIKMPVMDGIELLKVVSEKYPCIYTVIISGYEDFNYARAAIKTRVTDYLLKPIDKEAFIETISRIYDKLTKDYDAVETNIISDVTAGNGKNGGVNGKYLNYNYYKAVLLHRGSYLSHSNRFLYSCDFPLKKLILEKMEYIKGPDRKWILEWVSGKQYLLIFSYYVMPNDNDDVIDLYKAIKTEVMDVNFVYSEEFADLMELNKISDKMDKFLKNNIVLGESGIFFSSEIKAEGVHRQVYPDGVTMAKFNAVIQSRDNELMIKEIDKLKDIWQKQRVPQFIAERDARQILQYMQKNFYDLVKVDLEQEFYELIPIIKNYDEMAEILKNIVVELFAEPVKSSGLGEETMKKVDVYIKDNLDKAITLQSACNCLCISQPYLSKIVRIHKSMSFNEYITNLRIQKAKEIFDSSPEILIRDVANIVGYEDQHYFSRVFKFVNGISPSEYKQKNIY